MDGAMKPTLATRCQRPIKPWAGSRFQPLARLPLRQPLGP